MKICGMTIAEIKMAIEAKLKALMERKEFSETDKTIKQNEEATKRLLQQRKFKKFNHFKRTPKPDSTISNQKNKAMTGKPKKSYAKTLMGNSTPLQNNKRSLKIQLRPQTLKEQLKAQDLARQTFKRGKSSQRDQNLRPPSQSSLQTNQSYCDKEILRLQTQIESLRRQGTNTKSKKLQLSNQNYLNQNSHSKDSVAAFLSGGQTQDVEV